MGLPIWRRQDSLFEETTMAKAKTPTGRRTQTAQPAIAGAVAADAPSPKKRTSIPQFAGQVRAEARKIVWPSRKETWITSVMVFIMVAIATVFFFVVDAGLAYASRFILAIGQ
jgi:preprotein translocase subunit SecE